MPEALILGVVSGLLGFVLGYLLCLAIGSVEIRNPFLDVTRIPLAHSLWHYVIALGVAMASSFAAGYLPARRAARAHPVEIIRGATCACTVAFS